MNWSYNDIMKAISDFQKVHGHAPKYLIVMESDWAAWPHKGMTECYGLQILRSARVAFTGLYGELPLNELVGQRTRH